MDALFPDSSSNSWLRLNLGIGPHRRNIASIRESLRSAEGHAELEDLRQELAARRRGDPSRLRIPRLENSGGIFTARWASGASGLLQNSGAGNKQHNKGLRAASDHDREHAGRDDMETDCL